MKGLFLRIFYFLIVRPILTLIIGVRFRNRGIMKGINQFIMVGNHNSHFDSVALMAALPGKMLMNTHMVAANDYFGKSSRSKFFMNLFFNSILIRRQREEGAPSAIGVLDEYLKQGKSLILFPEGTRGEPGMISDFKKGVAILLQRNPQIPFIPVYLNGFGRVLPKDTFLIIPLVCKIRFGQPRHPGPHDIDTILEMVKEDILSLKHEDEKDRNQFRFE
ncbi:MAG: lysophospholipid acyltransferase family protein [Bacteroidota bacterium]